MSVHGLQPKRVVLQKYCSHPLSSRCCSILSAMRNATRCSSAFHFDVLPEPRSTSAFTVCCSAHLGQMTTTELSTLASTWSARIGIPLHSSKTFLSSSMGCDLRTAVTAAVWPSLAVEPASPYPLVYRSLSKVIKIFSLSSS